MKPDITVFYCINSADEPALESSVAKAGCTAKPVKMACSSMVKDVFLLRAFESGADGVLVLVCPEGACRHIEGNTRARKRVAWVQNLLNEIGIDGNRLSLHNIDPGNPEDIETVFNNFTKRLEALGPNPAKPAVGTAA